MTQPSLCPSAHDLEQFLSGRLTVAQAEELSAHFMDCPHCLETAHNLLKSDDTLADSLRGQSGTDLPDNPQLRELMQRLKALPPAPEQTQAEAIRPPDAGETTLESPTFLAPAQGPGEIGRLGAYRLLKVLGQGGMGMVFEAEDVRLKRRVALKVMRPSVAAIPSARQRFLREAQAAAALTHDHIIAIYQVDEVNNVPFLAMPILHGEALDGRLKREKRLPAAEVLRIGLETAEGLAAAHEHGLIHRDIKPGNLWLESPRGRVKILDFGLARVATDDVQITQSGAIVGTPAYMAPEQARGEKVDGRCDLFSLGCVLYRVATGALPFRGNDTMSMLLSLATDQPTPPRQVNPDLPRPLADLILQLLAKDPKDRPASARIVAERLEEMAREPIGAAKAAAPPRRRLIAGAVAAAFLGGLIALAVVIIRDRHGKEVARVTVPRGGSVEMKETGAPESDATVKKASPADERRVAEWVLSKGGRVAIRVGEQVHEIAPGAALPAGEWRLEGIQALRKVNDADLVRLEGLTSLRQLDLNYNEAITPAGLAHLEGLTNLVALDLDGASVTDDGLKYLRRMSRLKRLVLNDRRITDAGLEYLKRFTSLERLGINSAQITPAGLAHLDALANLTGLELANTPIGDADLGQLGRLTKLTSLELGSTRVSDAGLEQLKTLTNLKALGLSDTRITDAGLAHLQPMKKLKVLGLDRTKVGDAGLKFLQPLNLNMLMLRQTAVGDPGLKHLRTLKGLGSLLLDGTRVSDAGLPDLAALALNWPYGQLDLRDTRISAKGIASLRAALPKVNITWSDVNQRNERRVAEWVLSKGGSVSILVGDQVHEIAPKATLPVGEWRLEGISLNEHLNDADLVRLEGLSRLRWLRLRNMNVTPAGLAHLEGLTNLDSLDLEGTSVTDDGLKHLRRMSRLKRLVLTDRRITDAGLEHLRRLTSLESLGLYSAQITAAGLAHLGELPNLTTLELHRVPIGDAGLEQLGRLPKLTNLVLSGTRVSNAGLGHFKVLTNLKYLDLGDTRITGAGLVHLHPMRKLAILRLGGTKVGDGGLKFLQPLDNLNHLFLTGTAVGDPGLKHLRTLKNLRILNMGSTRVSDVGLADLAALSWPGGDINLTDTRISAKGIASLRAALPKVNLAAWSERNRVAAETVLALGGTVHVRPDGRADDRLVKNAAELPAEYFRVTRVNLAGVTKPLQDASNKLAMLSDPDFDNLQVLDLSGTHDYELSKLKAVTSLTDLALARTPISDNDLAALKEFKHLIDLSLARTPVSDDGLAALSECKHLRRLVLDGTRIVGFGLGHLKGLSELRELRLGCPSLAQLALATRLGELKQVEKLSLAGSAVDDDCLKALRGLDHLRELDLTDTKATEAGVAELRKVLPKCKVVFGPRGDK